MLKKIKQSPKMPAEQRREQILHAALKLIAKKGYRATTTEEIAAKAGLTKGAVYFHFKNKEEVLFQLLKAILEDLEIHLFAHLGQRFTAVEMFDILIDHGKFEACKDYTELAEIWIQGLRIPRIKRFLIQREKRFMRRLAEGLDYPNTYPGIEKEDFIAFMLSVSHGSHEFHMLSPSLLDMQKQRAIIHALFTGNKIARKKTG
jgi:AcrR family transcriptional regulator